MIFTRERRENEILKHARNLDEFLRLNQHPHHQDIIIALGNNDDRTALRAGQLYLDQYARLMLITGGVLDNPTNQQIRLQLILDLFYAMSMTRT